MYNIVLGTLYYITLSLSIVVFSIVTVMRFVIILIKFYACVCMYVCMYVL